MYTVTIEKMESNYSQDNSVYGDNIVEAVSCETRKEAMIEKRNLIKKHNLKKYAGHIVNYSTQIELSTNF